MAFQFSVAVRNAELDPIETTIGTAPLLRFYSGSEPANCAASASGTLLAELTLPSDWMNDAASGAKTLKGSWTGTVTTGGTAGYFRILDSSGTTCGIQGSVTASGGGGDLTLDNNVLGLGQTITINTFTMTAGNA